MELITNIVYEIFEIIGTYGWYMFGISILFIYIYVNYIKHEINKYVQQRADAEYHKNPDLFQTKAIAMEEARIKIQEKYLNEAEEYQRKLELREEQKRIDALDRVKHVNIGDKLGRTNTTKTLHKNDYNPLMGAGTSGGYRPPKKSCCGK